MRQRSQERRRPTIVVNEDGGYLKASDVLAELQDKYPGTEGDVDPNAYVDASFEMADHPQVGDNILLFLWEDPLWGTSANTSKSAPSMVASRAGVGDVDAECRGSDLDPRPRFRGEPLPSGLDG